MTLGTDYSCDIEPLLSSRSRAILTLLAVTETCSFSFKERVGATSIRCAPLEHSLITTKEAIERYLSSLVLGVNVSIFAMNSLLEFRNSENGIRLFNYLETLSLDGRAAIKENLHFLSYKTLPKLVKSCLTRYRLFTEKGDDNENNENADVLNVSGWRHGDSLDNLDLPPLPPLFNTQSKILRIGIFGGSFNPITLGHLDLISQVSRYTLDESDQEPFLNEVWIVPCGPRPDKPSANKVSSALRYAMCVMGIEEYFSLSMPDISHSRVKERSRIRAMPLEVDEVIALSSRELFLRLNSAFCKNVSAKVEFHLIVGSDLLPSLPLWRSSEELMQEVPFIIVPRSGYKMEVPPFSISLDHGKCGTNDLTFPRTYRIATCIHPQDASSTQVRKVASDTHSAGLADVDIHAQLSALVPACVATVVTENNLY